MARSLFIIIISLLPFVSNAQQPFDIKYIGVEKGLSNNSVNCIFQDRSGFMWFGTHDGLDRYDGYEFKIFRHKFGDSASIDNNWIICITEDNQGRLLVGTRNGLNIYDYVGKDFKHIYFKPFKTNDARQLQTSISDLKTDTHGNIFLTTTNNGLLFCPAFGSVAEPIQLIKDGKKIARYTASSIAFLADREIWVSVRGLGLGKYRYQTKSLELVNERVKDINSLKADSLGNLWLGADDGLFKYAIQLNSVCQVYASINGISRLSVNQGKIWVASDGDGLLVKNVNDDGPLRDFFGNLKTEIASKAIFAIFHDNEGRLWIGALRAGIVVIEPPKRGIINFKHNPYDPNSLIGNYVLSFSEDRAHNLWIGTDGAGVSHYDFKTNHFNNYRYSKSNSSLNNNSVTSILTDEKGTTWMGTWAGGINRFDDKSNSFKKYACYNPVTHHEDKNIWTLFEDREQHIWAGTCLDGGLYLFDRQKNKFDIFDANLINMLTLFEDESGQLWGGDYKSIIKIDLKHKKHSYFNLNFAVRDIHGDHHGRLWVATEGGGLLLFNPKDGSFVRYSEGNGLSNNAVFKILEDSRQNLWLSTFNGISIFNRNNNLKFKIISQEDGFPNNELGYNAGVKLSSGDFAFGGIAGFNIISPNRLMVQHRKRSFSLTGLLISNSPIEKNKDYINTGAGKKILSIKVPYEKAVFAIGYVTPEYANPEGINYSYLLEGWDKGWINAGKNRTAIYTNVAEGEYVFKVRSVENNGLSSRETQLLKIIVLPPLYRTWWAYVFYFLMISGLISLYFIYRSRQIRLFYEVSYAKLEISKEKELNEKKLSFFTNISHEFRTPLTLIINPLKDMIEKYKNQEIHIELKTIHRNSKRLLTLIDQLLQFRKVENETGTLNIQKINIKLLCHEIFECFSQAAKMNRIKYHLITPDEDLILYLDQEKIEIILFNLLSNAFKYTPNNGTITISLTENENDVQISVADNGIGINEIKGHENKIFDKFYQTNQGSASYNGFGIGLYIVKEFAKSHHGSIHYSSAVPNGSIFTLTLLKGVAHFQNATIAPTDFNQKNKLDHYIEESLPGTYSDNIEDVLTDQKTILLIDDDDDIRIYIRKILADRYIVHEAGDGLFGFEMALKYLPDLIISDINMKGFNGVELCSKVKAEKLLEHIPIILLTATTSKETQLLGIECGADDYIIKPFDNKLLIAKIGNILNNRNKLQHYFLDTITLKNNPGKISADYKIFLEKCITIIENNLDNEALTIDTLATELNLSLSGLYKKIKLISGLSGNAFIRFIRLRRAAILLLTTEININEAAFRVGINDIKYFRTQFRKLFGLNPSAYVKKFKGNMNKDYKVIIPKF